MILDVKKQWDVGGVPFEDRSIKLDQEDLFRLCRELITTWVGRRECLYAQDLEICMMAIECKHWAIARRTMPTTFHGVELILEVVE